MFIRTSSSFIFELLCTVSKVYVESLGSKKIIGFIGFIGLTASLILLLSTSSLVEIVCVASVCPLTSLGLD
jgi:hypothetical protein